MENIATRVVWPIIRALGLTAISQGVLIFLKGKGYDVANWVATMLNLATSQENISAVSLIIAGIIGIFGSLLYEYWKKSKLTKPLQIAKGVPQETIDVVKGKKAERDTGMLEALAFLQSGHWGLIPNNLLATKDTDRQPILNCLQDMRQAALDGDIRVWGRSSPGSPQDLIPKGEWKILKIKFLSLFHDNSQTKTELAEIGVNSPLKYHDLMVSRLEVEQKWPT